MGDTIDLVQEWNELHTRVSLQNQALRAAPETDPRFDGTHCVDCDAKVEPERLKLQRVRCAECAHYADRAAAAAVRNGRAP